MHEMKFSNHLFIIFSHFAKIENDGPMLLHIYQSISLSNFSRYDQSYIMSEYLRAKIKKEYCGNHLFKTTFENCILKALRARKWEETFTDDWDILWCKSNEISSVFYNYLSGPGQRVKHFKENHQLYQRDLFIKNIQNRRRQLKQSGQKDEAQKHDFIPMSFMIPTEIGEFIDDFKRASSGKNVWIVKPIGRFRSKGVFIVTKLREVREWIQEESAQPRIVQKYIMNRMVLGGKNFDLRVYVLCTSFNPLTAFLYRSGVVWFKDQIHKIMDQFYNLPIHLTGMAVNKRPRRVKWQLQKLKLLMISKFGEEPTNIAFSGIQSAIVKSLQVVQHKISFSKNSFQLFGFDFLFDTNLKPWLLEVNKDPSMTAHSPEDQTLKCGLLDDIFTILDLEKILKRDEQSIGGFQAIISKGVLVQNSKDPSKDFSYLGCKNNRIAKMKALSSLITKQPKSQNPKLTN